MALEIRPYREEEAAAFLRMGSIVFGNYNGEQPVTEERIRRLPPEWSLCAFEDGELATTYAAYPMVQRLNGGKAPVAGVTMVGTLPWFRRRGYLRKIFETDLRRRYEERMQPIAALLASIAGIYQRYGYGVCSTSVKYTIDPRWVNFTPSLPPARGSWRAASTDELPLLQNMYRDFSAGRNGYMHRAPITWDMQVLVRDVPADFGGAQQGPSLLAVYEEDGEPQGYLAFASKFYETFGDGGGAGQRLFVRDFVWLTPGAYRGIWEFMKGFDLVTRIHLWSAPIDDPAPHILLDPRELQATARDHLICRIIDLERALPLRPYGEGRVTFEVRDTMCPWNDGRWSLEAGPEGSAVTRTKETPQLSLDISALTQLMYGQLSATQLLRHGRAEASPDALLPLWDAMFRTAHAPFCPDGF